MYIWFAHTQSSNMFFREQFWNWCEKCSQALRLCSPIRWCHWLNSIHWRDCGRASGSDTSLRLELCNQPGAQRWVEPQSALQSGRPLARFHCWAKVSEGSFLVGQDIQLYPATGWGWRLFMVGWSLSGLPGWVSHRLYHDWVDSPAVPCLGWGHKLCTAIMRGLAWAQAARVTVQVP